MKMTLRTVAIATSTVVCATLWSIGWSEQGGVSLSVSKAEAQRARVYIRSGYYGYGGSGYVDNPSWYAVRAYYMVAPGAALGTATPAGPDYAARNGIGCVPGTAIKGGDGIMYNCQ